MNRLPLAIAGLDIATSGSELVATTLKSLAVSITYVSPSSLRTKIFPLYAHGNAVKPPYPRATRWRTCLFCICCSVKYSSSPVSPS